MLRESLRLSCLSLLFAGTLIQPVAAQNAALEEYKQKDMPYRFLQINVERYKTLTKIGLTREDWCSLAESYDQYAVQLKKTIDQRWYLTSDGRVTIKQADLDRFKVFQDGIAVEKRNAERRCR